MHKLALINIIQYCLGEDSCARILLSIQNRTPGLNMVYNAGFANSAWEERKHPRAKDGKFASSPGGGEPEVTREEIDDAFDRQIETMDDLDAIQRLEEEIGRRRGASTRKHGKNPSPGSYLAKHRDKVDKLRQDISEYKDLVADEEKMLESLYSMTKGELERLDIKDASRLRCIKEHSDDAAYYRRKIKQSEDRLKMLEKRDPARHSEVIADHLK